MMTTRGPSPRSTASASNALDSRLANMPPLNMAHIHGSSLMLDDHHEYGRRSPPQAKKPVMSLSPACNFEAFSHHFHLPLKTAAEKFGVRATAFKKRCRAIGIRHWPYRKVRSLKRSLQELNRCKDQGTLNDKQLNQFNTFKKQLDKLMAPETYGIDPSGRIPQHHFEDDGNDEDDDSGDDDSYGSQSPRYGSASFTDCSISPAEADKTFGDFSGPTHLRSLRKQQSNFMMPSSHLGKSLGGFSSNELPTYKFPYVGYDHYLHESAVDKPLHAMRSMGHRSDEQDFDHAPSSSSGMDGHYMPSSEVTYEESRPHNDPSEPQQSQQQEADEPNSHLDYNSERFFDDVFLQISPDYGCLV
ncbi:hypothetical protein P43SY_004416 [Pythium insidiosum]|uniref:RWP-RK domain-containing protein n=1 Tax=Pythium insidiosum TaxID=114742 RepID=A0AAD5LSH6_PYTIN|nr:hypothetical protein P43SY_004416 [Pythium insidiosum]